MTRRLSLVLAAGLAGAVLLAAPTLHAETKMLINPYPWPAPLEEVRLKRP